MDTSTLTPGIQQGVQLALDALKEMTEDEDKPFTAEGVGLIHNLSVQHPGDAKTKKE